MLKWIVTIVLCSLVAGAAAAQEAAPIEPWVCPDEVLALENKTLNIFNWSTYIAEDTIPNFEAACGVRVTQDVFANNEELLARLRAGNPGFDIIVPTDYIIAIMVAEDLLLPLEKAHIPNFANLNPALLDRDFDPGNRYTVPYQWGTVGVGYNRQAIAQVLGVETITSWNQVFDYPRRTVAWVDDPRVILGLGLLLQGFDPNTTNPDEIETATQFLIDKGRRTVFRIAADDGQELLARGEADVVIENSGDIFQVALACQEDPGCQAEYDYVIPEEGGNLWMDNLAIPARAQNQRLAEAFIDYVLHPQVGADISNYIAYASPNQAAIDAGLIDETLLASPIIYPDAALLETLFEVKSFPDDPEVEQFYNDAWDELKIRIGY